MKQQILYRDEKTGRYVSTKQPKAKKPVAMLFDRDMNATLTGNADEQIKESITEFLKENAWLEEEEPKHEEVHIWFRKDIETICAVTIGLIWVLLFVAILYLGVRV